MCLAEAHGKLACRSPQLLQLEEARVLRNSREESVAPRPELRGPFEDTALGIRDRRPRAFVVAGRPEYLRIHELDVRFAFCLPLLAVHERARLRCVTEG